MRVKIANSAIRRLDGYCSFESKTPRRSEITMVLGEFPSINLDDRHLLSLASNPHIVGFSSLSPHHHRCTAFTHPELGLQDVA